MSSAAIVAVDQVRHQSSSRSTAFYDTTNEDWRAPDPFEARDGREGALGTEAVRRRLGGPIIQDRMHFFVTYETQGISNRRAACLRDQLGRPDCRRTYASLVGNFNEPFDEDLFFGKID